MDLTTILSIFVYISNAFALYYGLVCLKGKTRGYFYPFIVFGFFCSVIGGLYIILLLLTGNNGMVFSLGSLGAIGSPLCYSFACRMIEKVDSCEVNHAIKYKHMALVETILFVVCWIILLVNGMSFEVMVLPTLLLFSAMPCGYYCFRNIITPFPKGSLARCLRPFFVFTLMSCICQMLIEMSWLFKEINIGYLIYSGVLVVVFFTSNIMMPIFLEKGTKEWMKL